MTRIRTTTRSRTRIRTGAAAAVAFALSGLLAGAAWADGFVIDHTCVDESGKKIPQASLDSARRLDVLFGHQSVGGNILDGLAGLAEQDAKRYALERRMDPDADWFNQNAGVGDFEVGENENPRSKIDHFKTKVAKDGLGRHVGVAMMKLCFVDMTGEHGSAASVFAAYRDMMEGLEKQFPKVRLVWWTCPLEEENNAARAEFNRLVREHCQAKGKVLFDFADIESHDAGGKERREAGVPALCHAYSEDGGHLNEAGRRRAALGWWWLLARLAGWDGKSGG